jgi:hypothetical protein
MVNVPTLSGFVAKETSSLMEATPFTNDTDEEVVGLFEMARPSTEGNFPLGGCRLPLIVTL